MSKTYEIVDSIETFEEALKRVKKAENTTVVKTIRRVNL